MKNLLIIFFIAVLIVSSIQISAQTWSTNGIKMYINPTTTYVGIGTNNPESELEIYRGNIAIGGAYKKFLIHTQYWSSTSNKLIIVPKNSGSWDFNKEFEFWDNGDFIVKGGGIGIGLNVPSGVKLAVDGKIICEEIEVKNIAADFVFDKNYKLLTLTEVESFIKENGHLPGIAPASETINGINLSEFNQSLLQKVEELTLYVIELKKENEKLTEKVNNLK